MKLNTVNVLELVNGNLQNICSFTDNSRGNKEAEALFGKSIINDDKNNGTDKHIREDSLEHIIEICTENGYYENKGYELFLTHSN